MSITNHTPYPHLVDRAIAASDAAGLPPIKDINLKILMNPRHRTKGGVCKFYRATRECIVELNELLFQSINDEERYDILSHEIAHAICFHYGIGAKHDFGWQSVHRKLGGTSEHCHQHFKEIKHNMVRRVVAKDNRTGKLEFLTTNFSNRLKKCICYDSQLTRVNPYQRLGEIALDKNNRTIQWLERSASLPSDAALYVLREEHRCKWKVIG